MILKRVYHLTCLQLRHCSTAIPRPLRPLKPKSLQENTLHKFEDSKLIRTIGGNGGDGKVSFLTLWRNDHAGPDGGDGGNGGHVVFVADHNVTDFSHIENTMHGLHGENGNYRDRHGKGADHNMVSVPIGTIIKNSVGQVVGDLHSEGFKFVAARGGAGGRGNHYFATDTLVSPQIAEKGAIGEDLHYQIELRSMAHVGLLGFPNAGKSTLLRAITRARPKVAPYPFTTLRPHIGMVQYDDMEQIAVADLPGLIPDSHKNRGLGIQFLRHVERCAAIVYILDMSVEAPWGQLHNLQYELEQFSDVLLERSQLIIANKMDLEVSERNLVTLRDETDLKIIPISAKMGTNLLVLMNELRQMCDVFDKKRKESVQ